MRTVWAALPQGNLLSPKTWYLRHRAIVLFLWIQAAGLAGFGVLAGETLVHSLLEGGLVAGSALLANVASLPRRMRSAVASLGLVTASAVLVHLSGGYIEMHFHFFVMVGLLALYQDWAPFLLALGFVVLHHGTLGVLVPSSVYNHAAAWANPWTWAAIHGVFVLGASGVSLIAWRLNEVVQARFRETNAALERQALELRTKHAELDSFVHSVSHDLRTPLVAAHAAVGALVEDDADELPPRARHRLERLQVNLGLMEALLDDILVLSRVGRDRRGPQPVHLVELLDDVLADLAQPIRNREVKVVVTATGTLWGVRSELRQVFMNLVGNAVKYLGDVPNATIEIGAETQGRVVECHVRDNGIGIDPAYHGKIFEVFQRLQDVPAQGTGVGLTIVKKIVEGTGGRVWVESARGQGATFRFTWPTAPAAQVA